MKPRALTWPAHPKNLLGTWDMTIVSLPPFPATISDHLHWLLLTWNQGLQAEPRDPNVLSGAMLQVDLLLINKGRQKEGPPPLV